VPFASVVSAFNTVDITNVTEVSAVSCLAITATQENSFNQDINGITNGISSSTTFINWGALSQPNSVNPISSSGPLVVPEPSTSAMLGLICLGAMGVIGLRRRQHR
jgi:predicted dinucleotide-binding enzyme